MKTFRDYLNQIDGVSGPREGDALDLVINEEIVLEADVVDRDGNNVFIGMDNLSYQMLEEAGIVEASWRDIYNLNKGVIGADPNKIKPGQVLKMPDGSSYTVKTGDNLTRIAGSAGGQQAAQPAADAAPAATPAAAPAATDAASLKAAQDAAAGKEPAAAPPPDAMAGADAGDQTTSNYTGQDIKSPDQQAPQDAMAPAPATGGDTASSQASADLDRLKQLAVGQPTQNQAGSNVGSGYAAAASPAASQAAQPAAAAAPAASGIPNPWEGKDPAKAAAWAKLSPQVQKKIGNADPTDKAIINRMVKGELGGLFGGGVSDAKPDGTASVATGAAADANKSSQYGGATSAPAYASTGTAAASGGETAAVPMPDIERLGQAAQPNESVNHAEQMLAEDFVRMMELAGIDIKKKELNEQGIISRIGQQLKNIVPKSKPPAPRVPPGGSAAPLTPRPSAPKPQPKAQTIKQVEAEAKKELLRLEVETKKLELEAARRNLPPSELKKALIALGKGSAEVAGKIITWPFNNPWKAISATIAGSLVMAYANSPEDSLAKWIGAEGTKVAIDALQGAGGTVAQTHPESPVADIARKLGVAPPQEYKEMSAAKQELFKDWVWWTAIGEKTVQDAPGELQKPIATMLPALQGKSREEIVTILDNLPDTKPGGRATQSATTKSSGGSSSAQPAAPTGGDSTPQAPSLTPQQGAETGGPPNSSVREGLRYFTRNPHSGKIVEVHLNGAPAAGTAQTVEDRYAGGLARQGRNTWHLDAWSETPISKIMKGKK